MPHFTWFSIGRPCARPRRVTECCAPPQGRYETGLCDAADYPETPGLVDELCLHTGLLLSAGLFEVALDPCVVPLAALSIGSCSAFSNLPAEYPWALGSPSTGRLPATLERVGTCYSLASLFSPSIGTLPFAVPSIRRLDLITTSEFSYHSGDNREGAPYHRDFSGGSS